MFTFEIGTKDQQPFLDVLAMRNFIHKLESDVFRKLTHEDNIIRKK